MAGLIEPSPLSEQTEKRNWTPVVLGVAFVLVAVGIMALLMRAHPKPVPAPPAYVADLKFSDLKMSQAQNFVGATVTYVDGTVTNSGDKTVTHAVVEVTFKDQMNQVTQREDVPLHVLQPTGPYSDAVDLTAAPLAPGASKTFRLTFEHVSAEWNQAYPELQITEVAAK